MSVSIKTVFDGNIHRFNLTKPSYDELEVALNSIYGKRGFSIRYQDEDGDMINVSSSLELQEALRVANGKTLKLILSLAGGDAFVCVNEPVNEPVVSEPAVVHVESEKPSEPQAEAKSTPEVSVDSPKLETTEEVSVDPPKVETKAEPEKKCEDTEFDCEEFRALACQFLSDPAVQLVLPDLAKAAITQVVEGARTKRDPQEAAARVVEVFTNNGVIQGHAAMAAVQPFLGKVQGAVARVFETIPPAFVDLLDQLKDGFQLNAETLMALLSGSFPDTLDCGKFDLGALGLSFASLPALASFPFGPFEFGFECKSPCQPEAPKESPDTHSNVRCDGCNEFPIVGPRYNCTVCPDFDLCAKCEAANIHPAEHPLIKLRQTESQVVVHHGITCDGCNQSPITGVRFKCRACHDFDLCEACEAKNTHPADHPLVKFKTPKEHGRRGCGRGGRGPHGPPPFGPPFGPHGPFGPPHGPPCGPPPFGPPHGPPPFGPFGPHHGPHHGPFGPHHGPHHGPFGPRHGPFGPRHGPFGPHHGPHHGPHGPHHGPHHGPFGPHGHGGRHPFHKLFQHVLNPESVAWGCHGRRRFQAQGSIGEAVKEIQQALGIQVDGFFGPKTEQAVKDFQAANSLEVDGIVGPRTRAKLIPTKEEAPAEDKPAEAKAEPKAEVKPKAVWWLNRGAMGEAVKELQRVLGVPVDGLFGPRTEQAVKDFQAANGLDVDGIVDPRTRAKLFASPEKEEAPEPAAQRSAPVAVEIDPALVQLAGMGFTDMVVNARLLQKHNGDLEQVVAELLA